MPPEQGYSAEGALLSIQNHAPQYIQHLIFEYLYLASWCLKYPINFMKEVTSSVRYLRQIYNENPTEQLKKHSSKFIKLVRQGYRRAKSGIESTENAMNQLRRYLNSEHDEMVTSIILAEFARIPRVLRKILRNILNGLRNFKEMRTQEQLYEQQYYISSRLCRRCREIHYPTRHTEENRKQRTTPETQDENSFVDEEAPSTSRDH